MNVQVMFTKPLYNFIPSIGQIGVPSRLLFDRASQVALLSRKVNFFFIRDISAFLSAFSDFRKLLSNYAPFSALYGFRWFRFVLYSGLGYKRRFYKKYGVMFAYIGHRDWILYKFSRMGGVLAVRRRNYIFFGRGKGSFLRDYNFFGSLNRKPPLYKMKGFLDARVRGRFLFVRRIRIRGIHTKLSKKQKLL